MDEVRRKAQGLELLVFLFLIAPSIGLSFFLIRTGNLGFVPTAVAIILRDLSLVALIVFFLWRNGEPASALGWNLHGHGQDVVLGIVLFVPMTLCAAFLEGILRRFGFSIPATRLPKFLTASGHGQLLLALLLVVVVAICEEVIFRGYLILRLENVTGSMRAAILLSAILFSLGHGYEGSAGVVTVGALGLVFALVYLWRGSLVAPMVMHFLQDFIGIVIAPLVMHK